MFEAGAALVIDRRDVEAVDIGAVRFVGAVEENRSEDARRQRLHASAEDFGRA